MLECQHAPGASAFPTPDVMLNAGYRPSLSFYPWVYNFVQLVSGNDNASESWWGDSGALLCCWHGAVVSVVVLLSGVIHCCFWP